MKLRCFVVDDEMHVINSLIRLIEKSEGLILVGYETDPIEALNKINSGVIKVDLVFMDISMPEMNGLELAHHLKNKVKIVFLTGHDQFALQAFDIGVIDYLLKPLNEDHFDRAINRAHKSMLSEQVNRPIALEHIFLKLDARNIVQIMLDDLICLEAKNKCILFHTIAGKKIEVYKTLASFEDILAGSGFIRVHKSYLVNTKYVQAVVGNQVLLKNNINVILGPTYREDFFRIMNPR